MTSTNSNPINSTHTVVFPAGCFLEEAKKEYSGNLIERLLKELLQNSIDAGATQIDINWSADSRELEFCDNGSGMTLEILKNGLLTFESSIKSNPNSVGGFGAAKKLILFSHQEWEVKTGTDINQPGICATGGSIHFQLRECEPVKGSQFKLKLSENWPGLEYLPPLDALKKIARLSYGDFKATFNGEEIPFGDKSPVVLTLKTAEIREKNENLSLVIVRFNGLYMFSDYSPGNKSYYYDVIGSSREALTQNRERFKSDTPFYVEYHDFHSTLCNNSSSGIHAAASVEKCKDVFVYCDEIQYSGPDLPMEKQINGVKKVSKREKMIYSLCFTIATELCGLLSFRKSMFGFYYDDGIKGLWADSKIWINPDKFSQTENDNWIYDCIVTFIHEYIHYLGHGHNESFISMENQLYAKFLKQFTGIAPIKAKMRAIEKVLF